MLEPQTTVADRQSNDVVLSKGQRPRHIGIVLDGNRRWARANKIDNVSEGHRIGFGKIPDAMGWCEAAGIEFVTLWMLSTDNVRNRAKAELEALYEIDEDVASKLVATGRFRVKFVGNADMLPARLVAALRDAEERTKSIKGMQVNMAIAYGGREDLLHAIQALVVDAKWSGNTTVNEERLNAHLLTAGLPDPDLIIRTSGESRTSGFLLWQGALAEFYFSNLYWPDFSQEELHRALQAYSKRDRRFGY